MNAREFCKKIMDEPGGWLDFERREMVVCYDSRESCIANFVLNCLANPKCEGSGEALAAIIERRREAT